MEKQEANYSSQIKSRSTI